MAAQSRSQALNETLDRILNNSFDILGVLIVSKEGLVMASRLPAGLSDSRFGALSASMLKLGMRSIMQLEQGHFSQLLVQGTKGTIIVMNAGSQATFVALAQRNANLGMMFLEAREGAERVAQILS